MDGSNNYYSAEQMSQVLRAAEDLQDENERLRAMNGEAELKIGELTQRHSSETQELMSQISLMKSTIADLGRQLREKDGEIVKLNEKIGTYSESDIILNRNHELQERIKEVTRWSGEQTAQAKRRMAQAKQAQEEADRRNKEADGKLRDFSRHLRTEAKKIQMDEKAKAEKKYREESEIYKEKLSIWTVVIAAVLLAQTLGNIVIFDFIMSDVLDWLTNAGIIITGLFYLHHEAMSEWGGELTALTGNGMIAGGIAFVLLTVIDILLLFLLFVVISVAYERWSQMWLWYRNNKVDDIRRAVTVGIVAVSATVAVTLREVLPVPFDFNWINWWLLLAVGGNALYHYKCSR